MIKHVISFFHARTNVINAMDFMKTIAHGVKLPFTHGNLFIQQYDLLFPLLGTAMKDNPSH